MLPPHPMLSATHGELGTNLQRLSICKLGAAAWTPCSVELYFGHLIPRYGGGDIVNVFMVESQRDLQGVTYP
jgi:hypothetical protein